MSAYKQFISQDIIITPFEVNHKFALTGSDIISSNYEIDFFQGIFTTSSLFDTSTNNKTGLLSQQYKSNVYKNVKQLYYSNFIPNTDTNFFPPTQSLYTGSAISNHQYFNYISSTVSESRRFPTSSGDLISVISIPSKLYGNKIVPKTFAFTYGNTSVFDDGEGNLRTPLDTAFSKYGSAIYGINIYGDIEGPATIIGNIIYAHGVLILTTGSGGVNWTGLANTISSSIPTNLGSASIAFSSSINVYETQYKCSINENEFNYSLNPSLVSGSNLTYSGSALASSHANSSQTLGFVTESYFSPYITTVGLYNNDQELIAVGKLGQPLQTSPTTDTTILINIDK